MNLSETAHTWKVTAMLLLSNQAKMLKHSLHVLCRTAPHSPITPHAALSCLQNSSFHHVAVVTRRASTSSSSSASSPSSAATSAHTSSSVSSAPSATHAPDQQHPGQARSALFTRRDDLFVPTLRDEPVKEGTLESHLLMLRAGLIRRSLAPGHFSLLPLGMRAFAKLERHVDYAMQAAPLSAHRVSLPLMLHSDLWRRSQRWDKAGPELFTLHDRHGVQHVLAPTHEEAVCELFTACVHSYRSLPLRLYQIGPKFRDEVRPRFGLIRAREFSMKDLYTFDRSVDAAMHTYSLVRAAYESLFARLGVRIAVAAADAGSIGGSTTHELHVLGASGEDTLLKCTHCDYVANVECAVAATQDNTLSAADVLLVHQRRPLAAALREIRSRLAVVRLLYAEAPTSKPTTTTAATTTPTAHATTAAGTSSSSSATRTSSKRASASLASYLQSVLPVTTDAAAAASTPNQDKHTTTATITTSTASPTPSTSTASQTPSTSTPSSSSLDSTRLTHAIVVLGRSVPTNTPITQLVNAAALCRVTGASDVSAAAADSLDRALASLDQHQQEHNSTANMRVAVCVDTSACDPLNDAVAQRVQLVFGGHNATNNDNTTTTNNNNSNNATTASSTTTTVTNTNNNATTTYNNNNTNNANTTTSSPTSPRFFHVGHFRRVRGGDACSHCSSGTLYEARGTEVGHMFLLGQRYSQPMGVSVQTDREGESAVVEMACFGLGMTRILAAVVQSSHDTHGIRWPVALAPHRLLVLLAAKPDEHELIAAAERVCEALATRVPGLRGGEVVLDDRTRVSPGKRMREAQLLGFPYMVVMGREFRSRGLLELQVRAGR